jgi:hypothetical protein
MWSSFPALLFDEAFGPLELNGGPLPTCLFWFSRELLWWLFIVLAAGIFCVAAQMGLVDLGRGGTGSTSDKSAERAVHAGGGGGGGGSLTDGSTGGGGGGPGTVTDGSTGCGGSTIQGRNLLRS